MKNRANILAGRITPPMIFFGPEGGAGGGGGGGGAAAAVVAPPAGGDGDPALAAADADVMAFNPPGLENIDFGENGPADTKGAAAPDPKAKEAADAKEPADKKAAADTKAKAAEGDVPLDKLRTAYETTRAELAALKETAAKGDPRVKELEAERDAQKKEIEDARREIEERKAREMETDPEVLKPLKEMDARYDEEAEAFYSTMEKLDHPAVNKLLPQFGALKKGTDGYTERYEKFAKALNVALGAEEDGHHPSFERAIEWVAKSYKFANQRNQLTADIKKTAATRWNESQTKGHASRKAELSKLLESARTLPEGMDKTSPTHPKVILHALLKSLGDEKASAVTKGVAEFIELAQLGVPPRTEKDYAGMSPEQIQATQRNEADSVRKAREHLPDVVYNGMIALRLIGPVMRDNAKLRERLGIKREDEPPDPAGEGKQGNKAPTDTLEGWKPPTLEHMNY